MTVGFVLVVPIPTTHNIPLTDDDYDYRRHNHHHRFTVSSSQVDLPRSRLHETTNSDAVDSNSKHDNVSMEEPATTVTAKAATTTTEKTRKEPELLQPFLPAADPNYMNVGDISNNVNNTFIVSRTGSPTIEELSNENILKIVTTGSTEQQCTDLQINTLLWKCLGYRFNTTTQTWETSTEYCFPNWIKKHPTPPDLIGMQRIYTPEIDKVSLKANQDLVRSIPVEYKQSLKQHLKPYGFRGYQYTELTPNKTRRAQCANWLLYYREALFGYTISELQERRRLQQELEQQQQQQQLQDNTSITTNDDINNNSNKNTPTDDDDTIKQWKPPVQEVY